MSEQIKHIVVEAEIPKGISVGDLSRKFKDSIFNITNGHWVSENERIVYITSKQWDPRYTSFLRKHKNVVELKRIGNITRVHIKSGFLKSLEQKEITIIYPTSLKNGTNRIEFLMTTDKFSSLKEVFKQVKIIRIADSYNVKQELTAHQKDVLWKAYSFGYFNYPRGITLTNLARLLKVSKASLSQTLRSIEKKAINLILEQ